MTEESEVFINLDGIPIPGSMAAKAVRRCIGAINMVDRIIQQQGFAAEDDLRDIRDVLTGEAEEGE